jgi:hypothetical protein
MLVQSYGRAVPVPVVLVPFIWIKRRQYRPSHGSFPRPFDSQRPGTEGASATAAGVSGRRRIWAK